MITVNFKIQSCKGERHTGRVWQNVLYNNCGYTLMRLQCCAVTKVYHLQKAAAHTAWLYI